MAKRLTADQIKYAVTRCAGGKRPGMVATELGVSCRHVQRLYAEFRRTGRPHELRRPGRRPRDMPDDARRTVLGAHKDGPAGVLHITKRLRELGHVISCGTACRIMKEGKPVTASKAESRKRRWVRYRAQALGRNVARGLAHDEGSQIRRMEPGRVP